MNIPLHLKQQAIQMSYHYYQKTLHFFIVRVNKIKIKLKGLTCCTLFTFLAHLLSITDIYICAIIFSPFHVFNYIYHLMFISLKPLSIRCATFCLLSTYLNYGHLLYLLI